MCNASIMMFPKVLFASVYHALPVHSQIVFVCGGGMGFNQMICINNLMYVHVALRWMSSCVFLSITSSTFMSSPMFLWLMENEGFRKHLPLFLGYFASNMCKQVLVRKYICIEELFSGLLIKVLKSSVQ